MTIDAFDEYSQIDTMYLYLLTRVPHIATKVNTYCMRNQIKWNQQTNTYELADKTLENYFKQLDGQIQTLDFQHRDEFKSPFKDLANKLIELFPKGVKKGTIKYWRGNIFEVCRKLETLNKFSKLDKNECIEATTQYIRMFNGDYTYMRTLPYFILKVEKVDNELEYKSDLLTMIENIKNPDFTPTDWVSNLV